MKKPYIIDGQALAKQFLSKLREEIKYKQLILKTLKNTLGATVILHLEPAFQKKLRKR